MSSLGEKKFGKRVSASFRDPNGYLFESDGTLYRWVGATYKDDYNRLMSSGLYEALVSRQWLVPHTEDSQMPCGKEERILKPKRLFFISYPHEWCFGQLRDAALLTLDIAKTAIEHDMILKDASAYNIQFRGSSPVFIDTLSFAKYTEGEPWTAYRQFCQHFLAPLALMTYTDCRLNQLFKVFIDGIPLDMASTLLPWHSRLKPPLLLHVHLHAASQKRFADKTVRKKTGMSRLALRALIDSLQSAVSGLPAPANQTEWGNYYQNTNYSSDAFRQKKQLVEAYLEDAAPKTVWDLGANTGEFSRLAEKKGALTLAFDIDHNAIQAGYEWGRRHPKCRLTPLLIDLSNPSPAYGWRSSERMSLIERGPSDLVMALALIHHLCISNNVPLQETALFFASVANWLIIEFVPKADSQVQRLLATREDIFPNYTKGAFEKAFSEHFQIIRNSQVPGSERTLYLMRVKEI